jgi:hypothetical protein
MFLTGGNYSIRQVGSIVFVNMQNLTFNTTKSTNGIQFTITGVSAPSSIAQLIMSDPNTGCTTVLDHAGAGS